MLGGAGACYIPPFATRFPWSTQPHLFSFVCVWFSRPDGFFLLIATDDRRESFAGCPLFAVCWCGCRSGGHFLLLVPAQCTMAQRCWHPTKMSLFSKIETAHDDMCVLHHQSSLFSSNLIFQNELKTGRERLRVSICWDKSDFKPRNWSVHKSSNFIS